MLLRHLRMALLRKARGQAHNLIVNGSYPSGQTIYPAPQDQDMVCT